MKSHRNRFLTKVLLSSLLSFGQISAPMVAHADVTDALKGNIITPDQNSFGQWRPDKFIQAGWSGYHIIAKYTKGRRFVSYSYSCGDKDCTDYIRDANGKADLCPDGDCPSRAQVFFYQMGGGDFKGKRVPSEGYIGKMIQEDNGSSEKTLVLSPDNRAIARFDEVESQQVPFALNFRVSETQVTTLMGFDDTGKAITYGHVEEADAPWMVNQTESFYKHAAGQAPQFITTVVERIWSQTQDGKEGVRGATLWCHSDQFKLTNGTWKTLFKNDDFNFKACLNSTEGIYSDATNPIAQYVQAGESRVNSNVTLKLQEGGRLLYRAESDKCGLGGFTLPGMCDGTQYLIDMQNGIRAVHVNSERIMTMEKRSSDLIDNFPSVKLVTVNWNHKPKFEGIQKTKEWINNPDGSALALLAYEKADEVYASDLAGNTCQKKDSYDGGFNRLDRNGNPITVNSVEADLCKRYKNYTLHYFILIPPTINGQKVPPYQAMSILDNLLAAIPDQSQPSPELNSAEEFGDVIQVLARYNASDSSALSTNFEVLVDLNTEEDSVAAPRKAQDFFSLLRFAPQRKDYKTPELPSPVVERTQEERKEFKDDI